jgi:CHAT domain-containing protein
LFFELGALGPGEHAITVLPSVASLAGLRRAATSSQAKEPFIGFGDPLLEGGAACGTIAVPEYCPGEEMTAASAPSHGSRAWIAAAVGQLFRGGIADVSQTRQLCPLPDTAHELKCVARSLGAPPDRVITGAAASETAVKAAPLSHYRIVHFATHGLLPGETAMLSHGLAEPALVLTPPESATDADDGLLTASEVTQLKLDADWVVLSACNTAGGAKAGGEALSGLARAFFYAGARTLLVSHWPVESNAATMITSTAFKEQRDHPAIGHAEALRRSVAALMDDKQHPWNAHPAMWAPFVVVGGGR